MKTSFDILARIYKLINISAVTDLIDGEICREKKPLNSEKQDIVINTLPGRVNEIQTGTVIINIYCKDHDSGQPNEAKLEEITDAVIPLIEDHNSISEYFSLKIINQTVFSDQDQKNMSYSSIRMTYFIENL